MAPRLHQTHLRGLPQVSRETSLMSHKIISRRLRESSFEASTDEFWEMLSPDNGRRFHNVCNLCYYHCL